MNDHKGFFCNDGTNEIYRALGIDAQFGVGEYMRAFAGSCYACTWFRDYLPETVWKGSFAGTSCNVRNVS